MILRVFFILVALSNPALSNDTLGTFQFDSRIGVTACDEIAGSKDAVKDGVGIEFSRIYSIDFEKAFAACRDAIRMYPNESRFYFNLGRAEDGAGKYYEARQDYIWAAQNGSSYAMANLGVLYEYGRGIPKDYGIAMNWYKRAAELGQTNSMAAIGDLYRNGRGVAVDYAQAMEWFQKSADQNNAYGIYSVGLMYQHGLGVAKDCKKAVDLYERAISLKSIKAIIQKGWLYERGICVSIDEQKAIMQYKLAAELGDAWAIYRVTWLQSGGYVSQADQGNAVDWFISALRSNDLNTVWKAAGHWYEWRDSFRFAFQERLKFEGFYNGPIDRNWSPELQVAIERLAKK